MISISAISCGSSSINSESKNSEQLLTNSYWILDQLNGEKISHPDDIRKIGFEINKDEKRISGFGGCNNFFGSYKQDGDVLNFGPIASTKMACLTSTFNEHDFFKVMDSVNRFEIRNNQLFLYEGDTLLAVFNQDLKLEDSVEERYWKLKTLGEYAVEMEEGQEREIHFILKKNNGRIGGFAGCNTFGGDYKIDADKNTIEISKLITTLRACPHLNLQDSNFTGVLSKADNYILSGDSLILRDGETELATFEAVYFD